MLGKGSAGYIWGLFTKFEVKSLRFCFSGFILRVFLKLYAEFETDVGHFSVKTLIGGKQYIFTSFWNQILIILVLRSNLRIFLKLTKVLETTNLQN